MNDAEITLPEHEAHSEKRAEHLGAKIDKLKGHDKMGTPVNVFTPTADGSAGGAAMLPMAMMAGMGGHGGMAGGLGAGLGAGLLGGVLGGLLFGGGRLGGLGGVAAVDGVAGCGARRDCLTPEMAATQTMGLATAIGAVSDKVAAGDMMLMNTIGAGFAAQSTNTLQQTIMLIQQANLNQAATMAELCNINQNVTAQGCMTRETCMADGATTRALIVSQYEATLNRKLVEQANEITELRNEGNRRHDHDELRLQITNTNTAVAAQAQGQQQQQQQQLVATVNSLFPLIQGVLQVAHATNSNVIAGNTGAVTTGAQTASPTNVNA